MSPFPYRLASALCLLNAVLWPTLNDPGLGLGAALLWVVGACFCTWLWRWADA